MMLNLRDSHIGPESTYYGTPTASINYQLNMTGSAGTQTAVVNTQTSTSSPGVGSANASAITGGKVLSVLGNGEMFAELTVFLLPQVSSVG